MSLGGWIALGVLFGLPTIVFVARTWIKQLIESGVKTQFEKEIELVKSDLRIKEAAIHALQANAMSGRAGRQALIDKRRIEALEAIWDAALALAKFRGAAMMLQTLNVEAVSARVGTDENLRTVLKAMATGDLKEVLEKADSERQRPFLPQDVWAIYSVYQIVLSFCGARMQVLSMGMEDSEKMFDTGKVIETVKAVLPQRAAYLDQYRVSAIAASVDPLYEILVDKIQRALSGSEDDEHDVGRYANILKLAHQVQNDAVKSASPLNGP